MSSKLYNNSVVEVDLVFEGCTLAEAIVKIGELVRKYGPDARVVQEIEDVGFYNICNVIKTYLTKSK